MMRLLLSSCVALSLCLFGTASEDFKYNDVGAHRYWRLLAKYHYGLWAVNELQFLDRIGVAMATARRDRGSPVYSGHVASYGHCSFAMDDEEGSYWLSGKEDTADPYIGYDFGEGNEKEIVRYRLLQYPHDVYRVALVELQYSDDGEKWTTSFSRPVNPLAWEKSWEDSHAPCNAEPIACNYNGTTCMYGGDGPFKEGHTVDFFGNCDAVGEGLVRGGATSAVCQAGVDNGGWVLHGASYNPSCGVCDSGTCVFVDGACDPEEAGEEACKWVMWEPIQPSVSVDELPRLSLATESVGAAAAAAGTAPTVAADAAGVRCASTYEATPGVLSSDPVEVCHPGQISSEIVASFSSAGHTVVRGLLTAEEVAAHRPFLRHAVSELSGAFLDDQYDVEEEAEHPVFTSERSKEFLLAPNVVDRARVAGDAAGEHSGMSDAAAAAALFTDSNRMLSASAVLLGVKPEEVCVWFDRAFFKEPGDSATHWHRDADSNRIPAGIDYLTAWVPLVDVTDTMGVLRFESGSHAPSRRFDGHGPPRHGEDVVQEANYDVGDVSFHHGYTKHASLPNLTGRLREVYAIMYAVHTREGPNSLKCKKAGGHTSL